MMSKENIKIKLREIEQMLTEIIQDDKYRGKLIYYRHKRLRKLIRKFLDE